VDHGNFPGSLPDCAFHGSMEFCKHRCPSLCAVRKGFQNEHGHRAMCMERE
jgi:hypothetical protein